MKKLYVLLSFLMIGILHAQVGIDTDDPQAKLDINGDLIIRNVPQHASEDVVYDFLIQNPTSKKVEKIQGNFSAPPSSNVNSSLFKVDKRDGITLLTLDGFEGWQKIDFAATSVSINPGNNFEASNDYYTVPSAGVYRINYEFRYGSGVQLAALNFNGSPRIGILSHNNGSYTILDEKTFSGANVPPLATLIISETSINSIYQLDAGDQLSFEVLTGGLVLDALTSSSASVVIEKISD